jgi:hypothetical protein
MDFAVFLSDSKKYIVCRALVPVTVEITRDMTQEVAKLAAATGVRNRLIDVRGMPNTMSVSTNYDLAYKDMEEMHIDRSTKVASLQNPDDRSHDFACTAIRNSGFNLRTFTDESEAIAWLEED